MSEMPPSLPPEVAGAINMPKLVAETNINQNLSNKKEIKEFQLDAKGEDFMKVLRFVEVQDWRHVAAGVEIKNGENKNVHGFTFKETFIDPVTFNKIVSNMDKSGIFNFEGWKEAKGKIKKDSEQLKKDYLKTHGNEKQASSMVKRSLNIEKRRLICAMNEYRKAMSNSDKEKAEVLDGIIQGIRLHIATLLEAGKGWNIK